MSNDNKPAPSAPVKPPPPDITKVKASNPGPTVKAVPPVLPKPPASPPSKK